MTNPITKAMADYQCPNHGGEWAKSILSSRNHVPTPRRRNSRPNRPPRPTSLRRLRLHPLRLPAPKLRIPGKSYESDNDYAVHDPLDPAVRTTFNQLWTRIMGDPNSNTNANTTPGITGSNADPYGINVEGSATGLCFTPKLP